MLDWFIRQTFSILGQQPDSDCVPLLYRSTDQETAAKITDIFHERAFRELVSGFISSSDLHGHIDYDPRVPAPLGLRCFVWFVFRFQGILVIPCTVRKAIGVPKPRFLRIGKQWV